MKLRILRIERKHVLEYARQRPWNVKCQHSAYTYLVSTDTWNQYFGTGETTFPQTNCKALKPDGTLCDYD